MPDILTQRHNNMPKKELATKRTYMPLSSNGGEVQTCRQEYEMRLEVITDGTMKN
jgi:hypothetical protein